MMLSEGLQRFVEAQERVYDTALQELKAGRKRGHWMWYIFPQIRGLGTTSTSWLYGIDSRQEAKDYLGHTLLGPRLVECVETINVIKERSAESILGSVDAMKLRSSATLFEVAGGGEPFRACLDRFFGGQQDERTIALLGREG